MSAVPSLSYATGNTPRPTGRRFVISLRVTALVLLLLALLVGWNSFSYFGITHVIPAPTGRAPRGSVAILNIDWNALWKTAPAFLILLGFSGGYLFLSGRARRGSETGIFAAAVISMTLTLVSALWVLTLFVYGAINMSDANRWWESALSMLMIGMSVAVVPWLAYVTILGFDQMRRPRLRHVDPSGDAPPQETPNDPEGNGGAEL